MSYKPSLKLDVDLDESIRSNPSQSSGTVSREASCSISPKSSPGAHMSPSRMLHHRSDTESPSFPRQKSHVSPTFLRQKSELDSPAFPRQKTWDKFGRAVSSIFTRHDSDEEDSPKAANVKDSPTKRFTETLRRCPSVRDGSTRRVAESFRLSPKKDNSPPKSEEPEPSVPSPKGKRALFSPSRVASHFTGKDLGLVTSPMNRNVQSVDFPSLDHVEPQPATKRWFVWDYRSWQEADVEIKVHPMRFAAGSSHCFYFMILILPDGREKRCVARRPKEKVADQRELEMEVICTATAQAIANAFNAQKPVHKVNFLDTFLIIGSDDTWVVEPFLSGKHTKNLKQFGVPEVGQQKTPQTFSHYSHHYTKQRMIVLGLQGCGDYYRNPIIHTHDGMGFGCRNAGGQALDLFFDTHWCNSECQDMELEMHMAKKLEKRVGDAYLGEVVSNARSLAQRINISEFVGEIQPEMGSGSEEDLSILGLDRKRFDRLVEIFLSMDIDQAGDLDSYELQNLFQKAAGTAEVDGRSAAFLSLVSRFKACLDSKGRIIFRDFILCWTNNC